VTKWDEMGEKKHAEERGSSREEREGRREEGGGRRQAEEGEDPSRL